MPQILFIPRSQFERVLAAGLEQPTALGLVADMCRANALAAVKLAGSGHLGSSFSSLDIVTYLYYAEMNLRQVGISSPERDIYFSSKGHDVPGLYAVLHSLGILPREQLLKLRRLGGTCGHPDVSTPGIEANSGSLGMGISKGRGMAWAKRRLGRGGRVFVMTGDGELQEGQNYEGLLNAVNQKVHRLFVIVDHNKVQSDKPVEEISSLGDLEAKFRAFGWEVARCDGHDFSALARAFSQLAAVPDRPHLLICDTLKGRGVSFMEHPRALAESDGLYPWHSGAPDDQSFQRGHQEIIQRIQDGLAAAGLEPLELEDVTPPAKAPSGVTPQYVADAFGRALVRLGRQREDLVVLDADLSADCRLRDFEHTYPERFIENGIAEQDMVSMAGGLARQGLLPVVNSFGVFLAARANEQIYNNACEKTKIIYACHYAGLIPAGPGQSHQSLRDIALLGSIPGMTMLQPCNGAEAEMLLEWCVEQARGNCALRLVIGPSPRRIELPPDYRPQPGRGVELSTGREAVLFAYGPVMLHEALKAAEVLDKRGIGLKVVNLPWLNRPDPGWLAQVLESIPALYVLEDHHPAGGLADAMLAALAPTGLLDGRRFAKLAVEELPAWGTPPEVLAFHGLDGASLARRIQEDLGG